MKLSSIQGNLPCYEHALATTEVLVNFYDSTAVHRLLVGDRMRTAAFRASIDATVEPGDIVLDVGAGSGILSLFAARAGAARVYAVERAPGAAALARQLVEAHGLRGGVCVIEAPAETASLPEPVDVIVSEWLGPYGVDENMLAPVLAARDRWLKPGGRLIPSSVTAWLAPVHHAAGREATAFLGRPYGLDLSALSPFSLDEAVWLPVGVEPQCLRAEPQTLWETDCARTPAARAHQPYAAELAFRLTEGGVNGVVAWFSAEMPGTDPLSNGPGQPATHWGQFLFPIANAAASKRDDLLSVGFHNVPSFPTGSHHIWASQLPGQPLEVHDTRRAPRPFGAPPWRVYHSVAATSVP